MASAREHASPGRIGATAVLGLAITAWASPRAEVQDDRAPGSPDVVLLQSEVQESGSEDAPHARAMDVLELVNDTPFAFAYSCQGAGWNAGHSQVRRNGMWCSVLRGVCGTGRADETNRAGKTVRLTTHSVGELTRYVVLFRNVAAGESVVASSGPYLSGLGVDWKTVPRPVVWTRSDLGHWQPFAPSSSAQPALDWAHANGDGPMDGAACGPAPGDVPARCAK